LDNDFDGFTDYPNDSFCDDADDIAEVPECDDDFDNDLDGKVDFGQDPGCEDELDDQEFEVPEPGQGLLAATALISLAGMSRSRRRRADLA
jgi:hypothetical protein